MPSLMIACSRPTSMAASSLAAPRLAASAAAASRRRLQRPLARPLAVSCAARGLSLAGKDFKSQKEAKEYMRELLTGLTGQAVKLGDAHFPLLLALLERHPSYEEKVVRPPVKCFKIAANELQGLRTGRELRFADQRGELISFSVDKCIRQQGDSADVLLEEAMRTAVRPQILAFRAASLEAGQCCARCGAAPGASTRLEVDHVEPFKHLVVGFKAESGKAGLQAPVKFSQMKGINLDCFDSTPADQEFSRRWQEYHRLHATLQLLCKACHLQKSGRQARATPRRRK